MDFATGTSKTKAWRDIWGSGQGIGAIDRIQPTAELVAQLLEEYRNVATRSPLGMTA